MTVWSFLNEKLERLKDHFIPILHPTSHFKLLCISASLPSLNQYALSQMSTLVRENAAGKGDKNTEKAQ